MLLSVVQPVALCYMAWGVSCRATKLSTHKADAIHLTLTPWKRNEPSRRSPS
jgi:hypothetical protein